jgi:hypothetical protein
LHRASLGTAFRSLVVGLHALSMTAMNHSVDCTCYCL